MSGVFITFEGGEGAGKSTQIAALASRLEAAGLRVVTLREPGGVEPDDVGERIRALLLDPAHDAMDPIAELLLYEAARAELVGAHIEPALASGAVVLCDRYTDSTVAYQGYGRSSVDLEMIRRLSHVATGGLTPDLTILLDVPVAAGLEAATTLGADRLEREDRSFHERVRAGFLALAAAEPERVQLVRRGLITEVAEEIWRLVEGLLHRRGVLERR